MDNGRIHDCAGRDLDAFGRQMMVHRLQHLRKRPVLLSITHNSIPCSKVGLKSVTINFGASLMDFLHGVSG
jgi:hypothetical protein